VHFGARNGARPEFRFRAASLVPEDEAAARVARLRGDARAALEACGRPPRLSLLLTGATGFVGKELLVQAVRDPHVQEVTCLVRPERVPDPARKRVLVVGARARGRRLCRRLGLAGADARKLRFVTGDIEVRGLGLHPREVRRLRQRVTHVVHLAASVSFDSSYEDSFRANVRGSRNVQEFSLRLQRARGSRFVACVAVETSYVHGRVGHAHAPEGRLSFPRGYYNNFYELTKAMATLDADRALLERGLRVIQLLPSIVVGHSRTGNNRGDTKVVNAPVNAFGRLGGQLDRLSHAGVLRRLQGRLLAAVLARFPADASAELNLVPVDRVAAGVLAALTAPEAVGRRIHLATDQRIRSGQMARVLREELQVDVQLADPLLMRRVMLPVARALLHVVGGQALSRSLDRLRSIFGVYSEWGQPIHDVGEDVRVLGLPARRPDATTVFRMLCRHNRYVQEFGALKDEDEIARRERLWERALDDIEFGTGRQPASLPPAQFRHLLESRLQLPAFRWRAEA
jgi:UDP-glucose 4-epimerase/long-chain acyl-CoA synthetase